jgi:5'-deoxynucleotidase YfbR-like HD superfamily hydrolase
MMALIHDWGEAVTGDVSYKMKVDNEEFVNTEELAFKELVRCLGQHDFLYRLWREYEEKCTLASGVVKFADVLDGWLQGLVTPTTWWPGWIDRLQIVLDGVPDRKKPGMKQTHPELAKKLSRMCELARDPNIQVWLSKPDLGSDLWPALRFFKEIYCLKQLQRHGFAIFGMKRKETDTFAGHGFSTASPAFLIALEHCSEPLTCTKT